MVRRNPGRSLVALVLVAILVAMPLVELSAQEIIDPNDSTKVNTTQGNDVQITQNNSVNEFAMGKLKGESDSKGQPLWFLAGLGCGIIGVGVAFLVKPNPPASSLLGQSSDYVLGYSEGYRNKGREKNTTYACIGWGVWIVIYVTALSDTNND
jgi:hypothetical protein